jgi:hypothetical protein
MGKGEVMNRISPRIVLAAAAAVAVLAAPLAAHHSTAMFEWGQAKPLKNMTVEKWEWTNPHTFLYARDEEGKRWAFEGMSPNHLVRYGWSKRSVAPGEKIDLTYYPLRDGRRGGFNVTVTKADGSSLNQFGEAGTRSR